MCGHGQQSHQCQQFDIHGGGGLTGCRRAALSQLQSRAQLWPAALLFAVLKPQMGEREGERGERGRGRGEERESHFLRREGGPSMRAEEVKVWERRGGERRGGERQRVSTDFLNCKCVGWESRRKSVEFCFSFFSHFSPVGLVHFFSSC